MKQQFLVTIETDGETTPTWWLHSRIVGPEGSIGYADRDRVTVEKLNNNSIVSCTKPQHLPMSGMLGGEFGVDPDDLQHKERFK